MVLTSRIGGAIRLTDTNIDFIMRVVWSGLQADENSVVDVLLGAVKSNMQQMAKKRSSLSEVRPLFCCAHTATHIITRSIRHTTSHSLTFLFFTPLYRLSFYT